jgi:phosphatidylserine synthase
MVSTFRYWSFKSLDFGRPHSYRVALPIAAMILVLAFYPEAFLPVMASAYALSGPLIWLAHRIGIGRPPTPPTDPPQPPHPTPA